MRLDLLIQCIRHKEMSRFRPNIHFHPIGDFFPEIRDVVHVSDDFAWAVRGLIRPEAARAETTRLAFAIAGQALGYLSLTGEHPSAFSVFSREYRVRLPDARLAALEVLLSRGADGAPLLGMLSDCTPEND